MKVTVIGGGSYQWSLGFCSQFIHGHLLSDVQVCLMDTDPLALDIVFQAAQIMNRSSGSPIGLTKTTELARALAGADFVLVSISTGDLAAMEHDLKIPEKYGIWHTVGDTVGPGGWSRAVRNIPVFHTIASQMKAVCPDAWLINVSNPLTPLTRVPDRCFGIKTIGMCPGAHSQAKRLTDLAGFTACEEPDYTVTGIDHGSWFTRIAADGEDVLARLRELGYCRGDGLLPSEVLTEDPHAEDAHTRAAFALWHELGYLPSLTDRHVVENFPWFLARPTPELPFRLKRTFIEERCQWKAGKKQKIEEFVASDGQAAIGGFGHGGDPILTLIQALCGHRSFLYGANYKNIGQIPGLPEGAVVETRCRFDGAGVHPLVSPMPDLLKCMTLPTVLRQEMIIDIALDGSFDDLVALVLTDPLCSRLAVAQCRDMVRELLTANRALIQNPKLLEF